MFKYNPKLNENQLNDFKSLKKYLNGNEDLDSKPVLKKYFGDQPKDIIKKRKKRKDGIGNYLNDDFIVDYMQVMNFYIYTKINKERERAWKFLNNEKESVKAGFVDEAEYARLGKKVPKQSKEQASKWAEIAYPKIELELWEEEFNNKLLIAAIN